ncbi:MAG: TRAP transporter small permease [Trueperaceae bacterium]
MTRTIDYLTALLEWVMTLSFVALFLVNLLNIVLRNIAGIAWLWIPGFSRLVFIWLVFLGIAAAYRRAAHLDIDFFLLRMKPRVRLLTLMGINLVLIPFFVILLVYGLDVAQVRMRVPFDTWQVPTGYAYLAVPVCAVLLLLYCGERLVKLVKEARSP